MGRRHSSKNNVAAFTLVELLVVIGLIGVLAGGAVFILNPGAQIAKSRDAQRKYDLEQIKNALDAFYSDNNSYPGTLSALVDGKYLKSNLIVDPSTGSTYPYSPLDNSGNPCTSNSCSSYRASANLERCSDLQGGIGVDCQRTSTGSADLGSYSVTSSNLAAITPMPTFTPTPTPLPTDTPTPSPTATPIPRPCASFGGGHACVNFTMYGSCLAGSTIQGGQTSDCNSKSSVCCILAPTPTPTSMPTPTPIIKASPCYPYGDVNLDGVVSSSDTQMINNYIVGSITLTQQQKNNADVNADGNINILDTTTINNYLASVFSTFPACNIVPTPKPSQTPIMTNNPTYMFYGPNYWSAYTMGYRFRVNVNGKITALWDYSGFGPKTLRLWSDAGSLLSSVYVVSGGFWTQGALPSPVAVTAGTYYRVSTDPYSNGGYYFILPSVPVTYGDITIDSGVWNSLGNPPFNSGGTYIYGVPDITFVPN